MKNIFSKQSILLTLLVPILFIGNVDKALATNSAPGATNLSAAEAYTEDTALNLTDIVTSDVDNDPLIITLTLSNPGAGALSTGTSGAVTSTYNAGSGVWTASGAIADVNALLAGLTFTPSLNYKSDFTIVTSVSDGIAPAVTGSKAMIGIEVNDAPTATNLSAAETYTKNTSINLVDIVASDVDSSTLTATLTLSTAAAGSLSTGTSGAVTSTYNAGTGVWTASGATASVNSLLASVTFTPTTNYNSNFTISTSVSDGVAPAVTGSKAISVVVIPSHHVHAHYTPTTVMTFGNTTAVQIQTQSITRTQTTDTVLPAMTPSIDISPTIATVVATTTPIVVNVSIQFTKDLYSGITDPEVKLLQKYLNTHGFAVSESGLGSLGNETGYFGKATVAALKKFQKANNIIPTSGYVGPLTRGVLNSH